jgi:methyl-accepting chemotaxis protein
LTQVANQIGFALNRLTFIQQQQLSQEKEKQAKEAIQNRALDLLKEVYDVGEGNLTIRARVTEDEIGTIADSYNSTIESLQKLVNQVKSAVQEVKVTTGTNEQAVEKLAQEAIAQSEEIGITLSQVWAMNESIKSVSFNAAKAQDVVKLATASIASGDNAMNQTVVEIDAIQATVTEAATKIKQLGSSSAEISQAVELISRFAAQTHLLALKASIEAARAGEQGKGFAVIADEVRSLATQSAAATAEIDNLVTRIQLETNEVVEVMKMGTQQVAAGTKQVEQTRQNLNEVTVASQEISNLVGKIASAALLQSETSEQVNQTMTKVAAIAEENSQSATQVAQAIKQLSAVAETLQKGIGKFKT